MTPTAHSVAEDSVRLLLTNTKNPARSFFYPWCKVYVISFYGFRGPGSQQGRYQDPPIVLIPA